MIEIRIITNQNVDRPEYGQFFEETDPYTGCGSTHFFYDRGTNTSATACDGVVKYYEGMEALPKWQKPIMLIAVELGLPWDYAFKVYCKVYRKNPIIVGYGVAPSHKYSYDDVIRVTRQVLLKSIKGF